MDLLLIHGALGNGKQLQSLAERIQSIDAKCIELTGHGASALPANGLSYELFLEDIDRAMHEVERAHLFGYSMGGYAALLYAARYPERVISVATLGSKLLWDEAGLNALLKRLDADAIAQHVPKYAERLALDHGADRWRDVVKATAELVGRSVDDPLLNEEVFAKIKCPVLLCSGDRDDTALPADTLKASGMMPDAGALILPRTKHPFDLVELELLVPHLQRFWKGANG